jgi:hypothetical protein
MRYESATVIAMLRVQETSIWNSKIPRERWHLLSFPSRDSAGAILPVTAIMLVVAAVGWSSKCAHALGIRSIAAPIGWPARLESAHCC